MAEPEGKCPRCGEQMVQSKTGWICINCGYVENKPTARHEIIKGRSMRPAVAAEPEPAVAMPEPVASQTEQTVAQSTETPVDVADVPTNNPHAGPTATTKATDITAPTPKTSAAKAVEAALNEAASPQSQESNAANAASDADTTEETAEDTETAEQPPDEPKSEEEILIEEATKAEKPAAYMKPAAEREQNKVVVVARQARQQTRGFISDFRESAPPWTGQLLKWAAVAVAGALLLYVLLIFVIH